MDESRVVAILDAAEAAVGRSEPLGPTGFWRVVAALKRDPTLRARHADRVAAIDTAAVATWAIGPMPAPVGAVLATAATLGGLVLVALGYRLDEPTNWVSFLAGTGVLLGSTHALAHYVVGRMLGIRFTHWFLLPRGRLVPGGVKIEYESYLRASARRRAWMHASGAIVTKAIPFLLIGAAVAADLPGWVPWVLAGLGVGMILNDVFLSTKRSDWMKFAREMRFARDEI
jgi:hypothetical protein